tara:strand:- start:3056 stop:3337 length:282 start_codon:yes stop_codon:yes gene_type:complete
MAFSSTGFSTIGGQSKSGNAPAIYTYTSTDAQTAIRVSGYFNSISTILKVGDIIFCYSATGGTPVMSTAYVNSNSSGVVDITDGVTVTATDTD